MNAGDVVKIVSCDECPSLVGKEFAVKEIVDGRARLRFGRGRPAANRPDSFAISDLAVVATVA